MTRQDFEKVRGEKGKRIEADIRFEKQRNRRNDLSFDNVPILSEFGSRLILNGSYRLRFNSVTFNVREEGIGPICRLCVNSSEHGDAGRHHKHAMQDEHCSRIHNLGRDVTPRPDLAGKTAREVFQDFCRRARIEHVGTFYDPEDC